MFKTIKKQAKNILFNNYKHLIMPTLLLSVLNAVNLLILNYLTIIPIWSDLLDFVRLIIILLFLLIQFIGIPLAFSLLYKTSICLISGDDNLKKSIKNFFNAANIRKIFLINLIPRLFEIISDTNDATISAFNILKLDKTVLFIIVLAGVIINYKLFASNYYFALTESSALDSLKVSFKTMKGKFGRYILLLFSFVFWDMAIVIVHILVKMVICGHSAGAYTPFLDIFATAFGYGGNLFLTPYIYLTFSLFLSDLLKEKNKDKKIKKKSQVDSSLGGTD